MTKRKNVVKVSDEAHEKLTQLAQETRRTIAMTLEIAIDWAWYVHLETKKGLEPTSLIFQDVNERGVGE